MNHVVALAEGCKRVLDVGAGNIPFQRATHVADLYPRQFPGIDSTRVNFRGGKLPFEAQSFDFVYCRHALEDLDDPSALIAEIIRVGFTRKYRNPFPTSRGLPRDRWGLSHLEGVQSSPASNMGRMGDALTFFPRLPQIEYIDLPDA